MGIYSGSYSETEFVAMGCCLLFAVYMFVALALSLSAMIKITLPTPFLPAFTRPQRHNSRHFMTDERTVLCARKRCGEDTPRLNAKLG